MTARLFNRYLLAIFTTAILICSPYADAKKSNSSSEILAEKNVRIEEVPVISTVLSGDAAAALAKNMPLCVMVNHTKSNEAVQPAASYQGRYLIAEREGAELGEADIRFQRADKYCESLGYFGATGYRARGELPAKLLGQPAFIIDSYGRLSTTVLA